MLLNIIELLSEKILFVFTFTRRLGRAKKAGAHSMLVVCTKSECWTCVKQLQKELSSWGSIEIDWVGVSASSSSVSSKISASSVSVQRTTTGRPCLLLFVSPRCEFLAFVHHWLWGLLTAYTNISILRWQACWVQYPPSALRVFSLVRSMQSFLSRPLLTLCSQSQ